MICNQKKEKVSINKRIIACVFIISYTFSYLIMPFYTYGDQTHYRGVYQFFLDEEPSIVYAYLYYRLHLGSAELIHFLLIFFCTKLGIAKDALMNISNAFLFTMAYVVYVRLSKKYLYSFIVLFSNFYFMVFAFGAERLKFGIIILLISLLLNNRIIGLLSIMGHFQMVLLVLTEYITSFISNLKSRIRFNFVNLFLFFAILIILYLFREGILAKFNSYLIAGSKIGVDRKNSIIKAFFFLFGLIFLGKLVPDKTFIIKLTIMSIFVIIVGNRAFIFSFLYASYYLSQYRYGRYFLLAISPYFLYKTIHFVNNIIIYGDGFA